MKRFIPLLFVVFLVSACGFSPLYGNYNKTGAQYTDEALSHVHIANIPDREGQHLKNLLIDRFYGNQGKGAYTAYVLDVSDIKEKLTDLDITKSSDATRAQLRLDTSFKLIDQKTGKTCLSKRLSSITSYNILPSEFATRITEDDARLNALEDLARQIELHLGLYFKRANQKE